MKEAKAATFLSENAPLIYANIVTWHAWEGWSISHVIWPILEPPQTEIGFKPSLGKRGLDL